MVQCCGWICNTKGERLRCHQSHKFIEILEKMKGKGVIRALQFSFQRSHSSFDPLTAQFIFLRINNRPPLSSRTMHMLSEAERQFIETGAAQGARADGRALLDLRPITLETLILPTASSSARVRIGRVTDILVGIKAEIVEPPPETPDEGIISFTVECSSLASPDFVGRGAADLNAELVQFLFKLYASPATQELRRALCLIHGKKCWVLHVDALVLDSGGNLYGALSIAVRAALKLVVLPKVIIIPGEGDEVDEVEIDEEVFEMLPRTADAPIAITLSAFGQRAAYMTDCTSSEEACAKFSITVGVNHTGRTCGAVSAGTAGVDVDTFRNMLKDTVKLGRRVLKVIDQFLENDIENPSVRATREPLGFFA